jgi:uncharacterized protein (DUF934 family)
LRLIDPLQDRWRSLADTGSPAPLDHALLALAQWQAARECWPEGIATGVIVPNDADVEALAPDLPRLALVALQFPKWTDGRAYSQARLLRVRLRFRGEVRAIGDVVVDMLPLLARTGFDAAQLRADQKPEAARHALAAFSGHYQGDVVQPAPAFARDAARGLAERLLRQRRDPLAAPQGN